MTLIYDVLGNLTRVSHPDSIGNMTMTTSRADATHTYYAGACPALAEGTTCARPPAPFPSAASH